MDSLRLSNTQIFKNSLPVSIPYITLGMTFGALFSTKGGTVLESFVISVTTFAGAAQFASVEYYGSWEFITMFSSIIVINLRHIVYTITVRNKLGEINKKSMYIASALTDENFGILKVYENYALNQKDLIKIFGLNHLYWIFGCTVGTHLGIVNVNIKGIEFFLTSLFVVLFIDSVKELKHS